MSFIFPTDYRIDYLLTVLHESIPKAGYSQGSNLVKNASSGSYYVRAKVNGKTLRESLPTKNYQEALRKRDKKLAEVRGLSKHLAMSTGHVGPDRAIFSIAVPQRRR